MSKSRKYWLERFDLLQQTELGKADDYIASMEKTYSRALRGLESDILKWYERFADNNQITLTEAQQRLTGRDLREFRWTVDDYIKAGKENALDQRWMKELENASARVHVTRLQALKLQMQQHIEVLYGGQVDDVDKLLGEMYEERYYRTGYEVQLGFNTGWAINKLNQEAIEAVLKKPWAVDGVNFSERIWGNRSKLVNLLHQELTHALIRGDDPRKIIGTISNQMGVSRRAAGRLVMTEAAFFASAGQRKAYTDLGVEKYEIVATLDKRTSEICQELDGEVFEMSQYQVGNTAPPFHVNCRTVTAPWFEDNYGERAARGEDGKTYYVPADTTYKQWKDGFVGDGNVKGFEGIKSKPVDPIVEKYKGVYEQWDGQDVKKLAKSLLSVPDTGADISHLKVQRHAISNNGQCQLYWDKSPELDILTYELNSNDNRVIDYQVKTAFHELFHAKSNGLEHGITNNADFTKWAYYDDVFAESWAHYAAKSAGIEREIVPSYAKHLIDTLPKLKQLPEFSACETIADFGEVAQKFRFMAAEAKANWTELDLLLKPINFDKIGYSTQYIDYIEANRADLIDKVLEIMPAYTQYRGQMIGDIESAVAAIKRGSWPSGNQEQMFNYALILSMNRMGVR